MRQQIVDAWLGGLGLVVEVLDAGLLHHASWRAWALGKAFRCSSSTKRSRR